MFLSLQLLLHFLRDLMKLSSYCFYDLKMIIFYWGHAWLISTRVMALWQFVKGTSCLCNSFCSFQWILRIPPVINPMTWRGSYYTVVTLDCFLLEILPIIAIITIEKPCQHNILRTTWARFLIFGIWLRINVYMTCLTCEQIPWKIDWLTELCPFLQLWHYSSRKTLSTWYLELELGCWHMVYSLGFTFRWPD